jgi:Fur family zinc uptake transcriptional regulator
VTAFSPQPCADTECGGQHDPKERLALAMSICETRGARLTTMRRLVLKLLWESGGPTGAYELVEILQRGGTESVGPPTVYRALEFLMQQGLVSKIESLNAFIPCAHPERRHICLFFLCGSCGNSVELEDRRLERLINENATRLGFQAARPVVEVEGTCRRCLAAVDI